MGNWGIGETELVIDSLLSSPVAIAHRGGSKLRPENTAVAFDHAVSLGVAGCECDVHLSSDGEVVVIHDPTLDRTTNAHGPVSALTARQLAEVDAGYHFSEADGFPYRGRGIGVPRLADLLDRYSDLPWIIELKGDRPEIVAPVLRVLRDARAMDRVVVGSFSQAVLDAVRTLAPDVSTGASSSEAHAAARRAVFRLPLGRHAYSVLQVPFRLKGKQMWGSALVRQAVRARVPVHAWIIDDPADMDRLLAWGVSGLISDRPDLALAAVAPPART